MPITPFHFGPGTAIKSVVPNYFSLRAFIILQLIIDLETIGNIFFKIIDYILYFILLLE